MTIGAGVALVLVLLAAMALLVIRRRNVAARRSRAAAVVATGAGTPQDLSGRTLHSRRRDPRPSLPAGRHPDEGADPS